MPMNEYEQIISLISLTMGIAWASGINLYAAILVLGIGAATGNINLPQPLQVLQDPMVLSAAGIMYAVEFFADKTPGVDTGWDTIHTFIRIPAGAMLAAASVGDVTPALQVAAGIVGGTLTGATHTTKAGSRILINTSPEPVSNWVASLTEDIVVVIGLWTALNHPWVFIVLLLAFILLMIWLLPRLWRAVKKLFNKLQQWLGMSNTETARDTTNNENSADSITRLKQLLDDGVLSAEEFERLKQKRL